MDSLQHLKNERYGNLIIFDIGMHVGQDTDFYLQKGFRVVAVEANPVLANAGRVRFKDYIDAGLLTILNIGISDAPGKLTFYINEQKTEWSSFHRNIAGRTEDTISTLEVETCTLSDVIREHGTPYYIKIDIEGNDRVALRSVLEKRCRVPYISVENGGVMLKDLYANDYTAFKFVQQNNVQHLSQAQPCLEGRLIDFQFVPGASGKFGEETEGPWVSYADAYKQISRVWNVETGVKNASWDDVVSGWFDLHARHSNYEEFTRELLGA